MIRTTKLVCEQCKEPYTHVLSSRDTRLPKYCTLCRNRRSTFNHRLEYEKKKKA